MGALSHLVVAMVGGIFLSSTARAQPAAVASWRAHSVEASVKFGIPVAWIERVMAAESAGQAMVDGRPIRSRAGAMGLMQLMPATWAEMRDQLGLGASPDDPHDNIMAGTFYLRLMYDRFGYPGLFAAYNAGPRRYADYLGRRASLPRETIAYLAKVTVQVRPTILAGTSVVAVTPPPPSLFAIRREGISAMLESVETGLFAVRFDAR